MKKSSDERDYIASLLEQLVDLQESTLKYQQKILEALERVEMRSGISAALPWSGTTIWSGDVSNSGTIGYPSGISYSASLTNSSPESSIIRPKRGYGAGSK